MSRELTDQFIGVFPSLQKYQVATILKMVTCITDARKKKTILPIVIDITVTFCIFSRLIVPSRYSFVNDTGPRFIMNNDEAKITKYII